MKVKLVKLELIHTGAAIVDVAFLLPGCKRSREVKFFVRMQGGVLAVDVHPIPLSVPKNIRQRLGEAGWERIRAESFRLFAEAGGPKALAERMTKSEAEDRQRLIQEATTSVKYAAAKLLRCKLGCQDAEDIVRDVVREVFVKQVMQS